jgi:NTE family protein
LKIGLALSGGGIKGAAHVGVIKFLEELGINIDFISGTSAGSIVAALYASGYNSSEMIDLVKIIPKGQKLEDYDILNLFKHFFSLLFNKEYKIDGILKGNKIKEIIYNLCELKGVYYFKDTNIPLAIPAVNINNAKVEMFVSDDSFFKPNEEVEYISNELVCNGVRASCSVPVIFKPEIVDNKRMVDGGLEDSVPVKVLKDMGADKIIAVNVGYSGYEKDFIDNIIEIAGQSFDIMGYKIAQEELIHADIVIDVRLNNVGLFSINKIHECIERGYEEAKKNKNNIVKGLF